MLIIKEFKVEEPKSELEPINLFEDETQSINDVVSSIFQNYFCFFRPLDSEKMEIIFQLLRKKIYGKAFLLGTVINEMQLIERILTAPFKFQKEIKISDFVEAYKIANFYEFEEIKNLIVTSSKWPFISEKIKKEPYESNSVRLKNRNTEHLGLMISKIQTGLDEIGVEQLHELIGQGVKILGKPLFHRLFIS